MKKNRKRKLKIMHRLLLVILLLGVMTIYGCSSNISKSNEEKSLSSGYDGRESVEMAVPEMAAEDTAVAEESGISSSQGSTIGNPVSDGRKLIKNVYLNVETKTFDDFIEKVSGQVETIGGYVENSEISGNSYYSDNNRYASLTVRVPSDTLNMFIKRVEEIGNVTHTQESVEDVTLQYVDIESHKKSLQIEQERLFVLLENAEELEDIIAIETRLSQVRYELEYYESQLRTYDNLIEYSKVTIEIREVERVTSVENDTTWDKIQSGFIENIYRIADGLNAFVIWFLISIPYILLWGVVIVIGLLIARLIIRRKKNIKSSFINERRKKEKKSDKEEKKEQDNRNEKEQ